MARANRAKGLADEFRAAVGYWEPTLIKESPTVRFGGWLGLSKPGEFILRITVTDRTSKKTVRGSAEDYSPLREPCVLASKTSPMPRAPTALLHRYPAPALHKGDRVHYHLRGTAIITSWTDAPIP